MLEAANSKTDGILRDQAACVVVIAKIWRGKVVEVDPQSGVDAAVPIFGVLTPIKYYEDQVAKRNNAERRGHIIVYVPWGNENWLPDLRCCPNFLFEPIDLSERDSALAPLFGLSRSKSGFSRLWVNWVSPLLEVLAAVGAKTGYWVSSYALVSALLATVWLIDRLGVIRGALATATAIILIQVAYLRFRSAWLLVPGGILIREPQLRGPNRIRHICRRDSILTITSGGMRYLAEIRPASGATVRRSLTAIEAAALIAAWRDDVVINTKTDWFSNS